MELNHRGGTGKEYRRHLRKGEFRLAADKARSRQSPHSVHLLSPTPEASVAQKRSCLEVPISQRDLLGPELLAGDTQ